jgi:hypothetical protein
VKTHGAAIDNGARIERGCAMNLTTETKLRVIVGEGDAALRLAKACQDFLRVVANGLDDSHPRDDDPSHFHLVVSSFQSGRRRRFTAIPASGLGPRRRRHRFVTE